MKCLLILVILIFGVSCASFHSPQSYSEKLSEILDLQIGMATESDVHAILGPSEERVERDGYYTLNYNDPKTGYQRLSLNFGNDKILKGLLWIPYTGETEDTVEGAKSLFKDAHFVKTVTDLSSPHVISFADDYTDEKKGVIIRYVGKSVEAIVKFDPSQRLPADSSKKSKK